MDIKHICSDCVQGRGVGSSLATLTLSRPTWFYNGVWRAVVGLIFLGAMGLGTSPALAESPGDYFDFKFWKLTLPLDANLDGKVDEVSVRSLADYSHPDFFYLDENRNLIFTAPNKAKTTSGSSNTRSELRQMLRSRNTRI